MIEKRIWALEERLWLEGEQIYRDLLDPSCLMAFPGAGVMRAKQILESVERAPRWASVSMEDRSVGHAGEDVIVLGYMAEGRRDGAEPYRCFCTSTYRAGGNGWKIVQHQQTPADE